MVATLTLEPGISRSPATHEVSVDPVVITSSTNKKWWGSWGYSGFKLKSLFTFSNRSNLLLCVWVSVAFDRTRKSGVKGTPRDSDRPAPKYSAWLKPRVLYLLACNGTGTTLSMVLNRSHLRKSLPKMRPAKVPTSFSPWYFRRWISCWTRSPLLK